MNVLKHFVSAALVVGLGATALFAQNAPRGALGITMSPETPGGVLITAVSAGSPAAQLGLQAGDRLLAVNGKTVATAAEVTQQVGAQPVGSTVELRVARGTWTANLRVALSNRQVLNASQTTNFPAAAGTAPTSLGSPVVLPIYVPLPSRPSYNFYYPGLNPGDVNDQHAYGG